MNRKLGITVTKSAVRSLVRELLYHDAPAVVNELPYQDPTVPLEASPEMDTTYRAYDKLYSVPVGTELVPHDKKELEVILHDFLDKAQDTDVPKLYHSIQRAFDEVAAQDDGEGEGISMKVNTNKSPMKSNVEEAIRKHVRKIVEAPDFGTSLSFSGYDSLGDSDDDAEPIKRIAKKDRVSANLRTGMADTSDKDALTLPAAEKMQADLKSQLASGELSQEEYEQAMQGIETREMTHGEMVPYLDVSGNSGVKGEEYKALDKMRHLANMDPKERSHIMSTARNEYIDFLSSGGDLTPEEVQELHDNPSAVEELHGFRDWLDAYVWDDLEQGDPVHYIPGKDYDSIRADKLSKGIEPAWPKGPHGEPVNKKGDWTMKQHAKAATSTKDRSKEHERETKKSSKKV